MGAHSIWWTWTGKLPGLRVTSGLCFFRRPPRDGDGSVMLSNIFLTSSSRSLSSSWSLFSSSMVCSSTSHALPGSPVLSGSPCKSEEQLIGLFSLRTSIEAPQPTTSCSPLLISREGATATSISKPVRINTVAVNTGRERVSGFPGVLIIINLSVAATYLITYLSTACQRFCHVRSTICETCDVIYQLKPSPT